MEKRHKNQKRQSGYLGATSARTKLSILVLSDMVGVIIGRGGSTIKEIMEQTHSRINVNTNDIVEYREKAITIYGTPKNCTNACLKILEVMRQKVTHSNKSDVILRILIHDTLIGLIIREEGNTIRNIMSETETKINVSSITDIIIDNINYKSICTIEGSIENISKAEFQISAKLRQSFEKYLQPMGYQRNVEPVMQMRNFSEKGLRHVVHEGPDATSTIWNKQTESLLCILVHSDMVHAIIGNRGSTIKKITQQTNAWVHVQPQIIFGSMETAIIIKGNSENCTYACRKILEVLQQKATKTCKSDVILKILIPDILFGLIIGEEGNTIRKIMSETETKINISIITNVKIDSFNYKRICTVEGSIENMSRAEGQISAKLRQRIENYLQLVDGCQIKVDSALGMKNFCEKGLTHVVHEGPKTIPDIKNRVEFTLRILVQSDMIPVIIGKLGSTINKIRQQTNSKVHVEDIVGSSEKAITIKGIPENCTNACRNILEVMQQKATNACKSDVILKILIHKNLIDVIIKEEGNTIKKIMSETNTNIIVPSITDITIDSFNNERIFTVEGSVENMSKAEAQISAKLRQNFQYLSNYKLIRVVNPETTCKKYKLIIVGHSNVGKTSIINRYCQDIYEFTKPTIGMDIKQIFIRFKNETIHLEIRDTAGTEKYCSLANSYKGAHGIYIVYDITDFDSGCKLDGWITDIETFSDPGVVKILIGSKCDDTSNRKVSIEEGQRTAKAFRIPFFEVSSKTNVNLDKLFYTMISKMHKIQEQPTNIKEKADCTPLSSRIANNSDVKPNTIPVQCPIMEKELPDNPNKQSENDDRELYKLIKVKPEMTNKKFKLIIVGHSNVGKSTLINRYSKDVYQDTIPTSGMDCQEIFVRFENETIKLNIWDTAGTEKYRSLACSYYRGAHGVFLVYDITDLNSSFKLDGWLKDVENFSDENAVKILIGNKCDDTLNRKISIKEGHEIAKLHGIPFFEVSSKSNVNIDKLFYTMISKIYNLQNQPTNIKNELYKITRVVNPETTCKKYKLIIVGHSNVGKSCLLKRFYNDQYHDNGKLTVGMDLKRLFVKFENEIIELHIWDTAGTEKYRSLAGSYYRGAHGVFLVYDITNLNSSFELDVWLKDVENYSDPNAVKILIGSKCDDRSNRKISVKEGEQLAEQFQIPFIEVSSKTNVNIDKLIHTMISKILKIQEQPTNINYEIAERIMMPSQPQPKIENNLSDYESFCLKENVNPKSEKRSGCGC